MLQRPLTFPVQRRFLLARGALQGLIRQGNRPGRLADRLPRVLESSGLPGSVLLNAMRTKQTFSTQSHGDGVGLHGANAALP